MPSGSSASIRLKTVPCGSKMRHGIETYRSYSLATYEQHHKKKYRDTTSITISPPPPPNCLITLMSCKIDVPNAATVPRFCNSSLSNKSKSDNLQQPVQAHWCRLRNQEYIPRTSIPWAWIVLIMNTTRTVASDNKKLKGTRRQERGTPTNNHSALWNITEPYMQVRRSQWPRGLRRRSAAERLLGWWVRTPPRVWIFVSCTVFVCCQVEVCATGRAFVT
jgi:hypothetical protein